MRELPDTKIDMYEALPVPFGLIRFGVAPDHPEVKNVQDTFQDVAASPNYRFIGNINLGHDLPLPLLAQHYDSIVFAYGASKDRTLELKGEENTLSARAFVGWYNGLPEYRDLNPNLAAGDTAIVIGQGNVALDVARTLLSKIETLKSTDITDYALQALSASTIKHVHVVGRRGPLQAAFTIKEIRELLSLDDVNFKPIPAELMPSDTSKLPRPKKRLMDLLKKGGQQKSEATKSFSLDFLLSPTALKWSQSDSNLLEAVEFTRNKLDDPMSPSSKISSTDEVVNLAASTLFQSIGYKAEAIPGMELIGAHFNESRGTANHDGRGRMVPLDEKPTPENTGGVALYCAGWTKRGPTGVIASTMTDAYETAETIVEDWKSRVIELPPMRPGWEAVEADARQHGIKLNPVFWNNWQSINQAEKLQGATRGKPREKFGRISEMLTASKSFEQASLKDVS